MLSRRINIIVNRQICQERMTACSRTCKMIEESLSFDRSRIKKARKVFESYECSTGSFPCQKKLFARMNNKAIVV